MSGGVFDDPGHGPAGHVAAGPEAGLQLMGHIARAPAADAVLGIARDVGRLEGAEGRLERAPVGLRPCRGPGATLSARSALAGPGQGDSDRPNKGDPAKVKSDAG